MSGASSPGCVRKNAAASGYPDVRGPRPSRSKSSKLSGVKMPNMAGSSVS